MKMNVQQTTVNALRVLSIEGIEKANSGHPGLPLGSAPIAYALFQNHMTFNPRNPKFDNRDRFILSAGHGSMLNYATLHLYGYAVSKEDLMNFRQFGSKTAGHPEYGLTPGIETTTGPLGQGIANAVGMAIAENYLRAKFNKEGFPIVDHYTYALAGDGCMQEGIENEAASLAGTLKLGKLIVFYDDNDITIEGNTDIAFREDVGKRHEALGWQVINVKDINDLNAINKAVKKAKACTDKPSLIICKSLIGYGSPLVGNPHCHGAPLGAENVQKTKEMLGYNYPPFEVPEEVKKHTAKAIRKGKRAEKAWKEMFKAYEVAYPELAKEYKSWMANEKPDLINNEDLWKFEKKDATRNTSFTVLNKLADLVPNLIGGSADLAPSNKSNMKNRGDFLPDDKTGSNMHFGIREHAMAAITNGMCVHGGLTTYCSTFFVFSDYMKNAIRLSALMGLPVTYVLTHDSIGVGEDGPTHQPVEHLVGLRSIPNIKVYRPADGKETTAAWISALTGKEPTLLVLTRQNLPQYENSGVEALKGGYILADSEKATPDVLLIASGSEVELCMEAKKVLAEQGVDARVVSMPCIEVFNKQPKKYREAVIPSKVRARVCVEAATPYSWHQFAGLDGEIIAMNTFGESAPAELLFKHFGFTVENVVEKALKVVKK
ncbi:MAG: transketolase [Clostridiales bacterium]|nr:transketolase [Clostridiales bacterium]